VVVFVDAMLFGALAPLIPGYADEFGLSKTGAGLLVASFGAGALLGGIPGGLAAARWGPKSAVVAGLVLLTVSIIDVPSVDPAAAIEVTKLENGFYRVVARFGFMDPPNVPDALARARELGLQWLEQDTTYYLAHLTLFVHARLGMAAWRDKMFVFLARNARRATNFFRIPPDRVVEIGIQIEI